MTTLYIDIETLPAQRPDVMEEIKATIKPPATFKKPESIAEWHRTEGLAAAEEAYRRTGLDGSFGQVCVIGFALDDAEPVTIYEADWQAPNAEAIVLECFGNYLTDIIRPQDVLSTLIVGHNVAGFDLRFLSHRSIVRGIRPHTVIARAAQAKPWESEKVFDTMVQWGGPGAQAGGSLDKLCRALSIPTPKDGDITGATVWDAVQAGRIDEVAAYCAKDIEATRKVHRRMIFAA